MLGDFFQQALKGGAVEAIADKKAAAPRDSANIEDPLADDIPESAGDRAEDDAPAPEAPETGGEGPQFTSVREEDITDPALRRVYQTLQQDFQAKLKQIEGAQDKSGLVAEHGALLQRIREDEGLREVIVGYLQGRQRPGQVAEEAPSRPENVLSREEFPDVDEDAFQGLENLAQRFMRAVDQRYGKPVHEHGKTVERVNGLLEQLEAQREMNDLSAMHPGWQENVDPTELARMKKDFPNVPVTKLYRMLDYDKAALRAKRDVFAQGSTKRQRPLAASGGRGADRSQERESNTLKGITNFEDAIKAAIEELGY